MASDSSSEADLIAEYFSSKAGYTALLEKAATTLPPEPRRTVESLSDTAARSNPYTSFTTPPLHPNLPKPFSNKPHKLQPEPPVSETSKEHTAFDTKVEGTKSEPKSVSDSDVQAALTAIAKLKLETDKGNDKKRKEAWASVSEVFRGTLYEEDAAKTKAKKR